MTFWVGEVADEEVCARVLLGAHPSGPAEACGLLLRGLDVGHADVNDCVARVAALRADPATLNALLAAAGEFDAAISDGSAAASGDLPALHRLVQAVTAPAPG